MQQMSTPVQVLYNLMCTCAKQHDHVTMTLTFNQECAAFHHIIIEEQCTMHQDDSKYNHLFYIVLKKKQSKNMLNKKAFTRGGTDHFSNISPPVTMKLEL